MGEIFNLPVPYKDKEWLFRARLLQLGYTHKFGVRVGETDVFFEPDEEEAYRALVVPDKEPENLDLALLKAVTETITDVLK
ncbi:MAG TPA: hypothetical protein VER36_01095 [Flavisolibacter sp.]|nr:hypothetical protein [Flavisolibacter sp.]